jgi:RimJ/RimL family protein N-acetyltransferase
MLHTHRLSLRNFTPSDIPALRTLFKDKQVMTFSDGTMTDVEVDAWLGTRLKNYQQNDGIWIFALELRSTKEMIGYCGLSHLCDVNGNREIEVGYRILPAFWGQGLATEAFLAVKEYAFATLGLNRLTAMIDPANQQSLRVAQKAGMQFEREIMLPGYDHPDHLYMVHSETV